MNKPLSDIGYPSHEEALIVFLVFGALLGIVDSLLQIFGGDGHDIVNVALEAFSLLCIIGLLGLLIGSLPRTPHVLKKCMHFVCLPSLCAGLSAVFIASGMIIGFGLCSLLMSHFSYDGNEQEALGIVLVGCLLLLCVWPIAHMAVELLGRAARSFKIVTFIYSTGMFGILFIAVPFNIWVKLLLFIFVVLCGLKIISK